jgi:hypothetical protein
MKVKTNKSSEKDNLVLLHRCELGSLLWIVSSTRILAGGLK